MLKEIKIDSIMVGQRHRRDMGDLTTLAESIRQEGLLQPIGVTDKLELVFGERRLLAYRDIPKLPPASAPVKPLLKRPGSATTKRTAKPPRWSRVARPGSSRRWTGAG
jgi:hypothetical protein